MSQYVIDYAIVDNDGRILMFGKSLTRPTREGFQTLDTAPPNIDHYWSGVGWVAIPTSPSPEHIFDYTTKQWVDPRTEQTQWPVVRSQRNALLSASDWTQLPDVPAETRERWAAYRQALRDITDQSDPFNVVWPVAPG